MTFRMLSRFFVICHLFICHWNEVPYEFAHLTQTQEDANIEGRAYPRRQCDGNRAILDYII